MAARPQIAVIIPVFEVTQYLAETLRSVLAQDHPSEIVVVDDGSSPSAAMAIDRILAALPSVRLLRIAHQGPAAARDAGVLATQCEFILYLDADDIMLPGSLRQLADGLHRFPNAIAVYGRTQILSAEGLSEPKPTREPAPGAALLARIMRGHSPFANGSICMRRAALLQQIGCIAGLHIWEDWVGWCHLAQQGDIVMATEATVLHYRVHPLNSRARFIQDHEFALAALDRVFTQPKFVNALPADAFSEIRRQRYADLHAIFASHYAQQGDRARAEHHFKQM